MVPPVPPVSPVPPVPAVAHAGAPPGAAADDAGHA